MLAYYSSLVLRPCASELIMRIEVSILAFACFFRFLSVFIDSQVGFSGDLARDGDVARRGVPLALSEDVHNFVQFMGFFRIVSNCTVYLAKVSLSYSRSLKAK